MDTLRMGVNMLFVLLLLVSCAEAFLTEPVICYMLDGFLMVYCILATALYFREKFFSEDEECEPEGIYQALQRPEGTDVYEVIDSKGKKQARKKKKTKVNEPPKAEEKDKDAYESLSQTASAAPLSPK